ncbi:hypothetical protein [Paraburkholderia sp. J8-2]|uniref:metallophosphoesterase family protein n=1 Tax=Paraburkholderia sp. J8-2 TaxID=2805440 RepID=UPI002AB73ADB|nr:hypothetical protein [Paraburkholderia sp. J8-2]
MNGKQSAGVVRIAQLGDLHYSPTNLVESSRCTDHAVTVAIGEGVDVAIFTGDSTDHKQDAHSPALHALMHQIRRLADHCPVLIIQGTFLHDYQGMLPLFRFASGRYPVETVERIGQVALVGNSWRPVTSVEDLEGARLLVSCVPTVNRGDLVASVGAEHVSEAMGDVLAGLMLGVFGPMNRAARERGIPTVQVGHGTVRGSMTEHGVPMAGKDHEFTAGALYGAQATATMLGHLHKYQSWERDVDGVHQEIAYGGSIGRFHHGEIGQKGFLVWTVGSHACQHTLHPTPARVMVDFSFEGVPDVAWLAEKAIECEGAFVRVRYTVDAEYAAAVDTQAVRQALANAADVQIESKLLVTQRQRCSGISTLPTLAEKVGKWCEATQNDASVVVPRVRMLGVGDARSIAGNLIKEIFNEAKTIRREPGANAGDGIDLFAGANRGRSDVDGAARV